MIMAAASGAVAALLPALLKAAGQLWIARGDMHKL